MLKKAVDLLSLDKDIQKEIKKECSDWIPDFNCVKRIFSKLEIEVVETKEPDSPENYLTYDVALIWLKIAGFVKSKPADVDSVPIYSWADMEAQSFIDGNNNCESRVEDIKDALEIRLSEITEMYLKTDGLLTQVKEKLDGSPA